MSLSQEKLHQAIIEKLQTIYDPELPVDIYALGLIYNIDLNLPDQSVHITMTLTTPSCPAADFIFEEIKRTLLTLPPIKKVDIALTFDPPYHPDRMSEAAKALLGWT